jgi:hypothetical protein
MSEGQTPPVADLSNFSTDCYWRFTINRKLAEYVRRRDGVVIDRRAMTPDEVQREMLKPNPERKEMQSEAEIRNQKLVGEKWNKLTLKRLAGQHATSGAFLGECECGRMVERVFISDVRNNRKPDCGAKCALRTKRLSSTVKKANRRRQAPDRKADQPAPQAPISNRGGYYRETITALFTIC